MADILPIGLDSTSGQQVVYKTGDTVQGTTTGPTGATGATGATGSGGIWTLMETLTFTASSATQTTADFSNASTAKEYIILVNVLCSASNQYVGFRLNGNSSANTYVAGMASYNGDYGGTFNTSTYAHIIYAGSGVDNRCTGEVRIGAQEGSGNKVPYTGNLSQLNVSSGQTLLKGYGEIGSSDNYLKNISIVTDQNITGTFSIYQR